MSRRSLQRFASVTLGIAGLWLVAFHVALFWRRIADATIQHPAVLARWLASALLLAGAIAAHRYAAEHRNRRRTLVFWLLVLALHAGVPAEERIVGISDVASIVFEATVVAIAAGLVATNITRPSVHQLTAFLFSQLDEPQLKILAASSSPRAPPTR